MSKSCAEHINDTCSLRIKDTFSCEVIHTPMPTQLYLVAVERMVVYYPRAVHTFSAGIKCRHCRYKCIRSSTSVSLMFVTGISAWHSGLDWICESIVHCNKEQTKFVPRKSCNKYILLHSADNPQMKCRDETVKYVLSALISNIITPLWWDGIYFHMKRLINHLCTWIHFDSPQI